MTCDIRALDACTSPHINTTWLLFQLRVVLFCVSSCVRVSHTPKWRRTMSNHAFTHVCGRLSLHVLPSNLNISVCGPISARRMTSQRITDYRGRTVCRVQWTAVSSRCYQSRYFVMLVSLWATTHDPYSDNTTPPTPTIRVGVQRRIKSISLWPAVCPHIQRAVWMCLTGGPASPPLPKPHMHTHPTPER